MEKDINPSDCENCGTALEGEYCHRCGQRKIDFKTDWTGLVKEFLSNTLNLEGKLLIGLADLAFRPWRLTREYLKGKRASQIPPLRAYLFVSLLFFLNIAMDFTSGFQYGLDIADKEAIIQETETVDGFDKGNEVIAAIENFPRLLMEWLPRVFLVGVVMLALVFKVVFFRSRLVYIEHLIVALNLQTFVFLWILVSDGWAKLAGMLMPVLEDSTMEILMLWLLICPIIALKKIYETSVLKSVIKSFLVFLCYSCYLLLGLAIVGLYSAFIYDVF